MKICRGLFSDDARETFLVFGASLGPNLSIWVAKWSPHLSTNQVVVGSIPGGHIIVTRKSPQDPDRRDLVGLVNDKYFDPQRQLVSLQKVLGRQKED